MQRSWILSVVLCGGAALAGRAALASEALTAEHAAPAPVESDGLPSMGLMADAGLPDGVNGSLVYRPARWFRAAVGGGYNMISSGVRGGVTLAPFGAGPSLTLEGGHYFEGNANGVVRKVAGASYQDSAVLERVGYDYANAHLGLELGWKRVTFYIHGGMSYVRARVHNFDSVLQSQASANGFDSTGTEVSIKQDPIVRVIAPSAKLGLIVYLW